VSLPVVFNPTITGSQNGTITITSNAEDNPSILVTCSGTGILPPRIAVTPTSISKQLSLEGQNSSILSISNTGNEPLSFRISASQLNWLSTDIDSGSIISGGSANIAVLLNASGLEVGRYDALLSIYHNADNHSSPYEIPVTLTITEGTGTISTRILSTVPAASHKVTGDSYSISGLYIGEPVAGKASGASYSVRLGSNPEGNVAAPVIKTTTAAARAELIK
jgi:hypothetical protein